MADANIPAVPTWFGGHWVNNLDPVALYLPFGLSVKWYGISYVLGIVLGALLLRRWARRGRLPLATVEIQDFALTVGLCMVVGGRLGFCLFYGIHEILARPWKIFYLWEGGMASHGGIIGLFVGVWWFAHRRNRDFGVLGDAVAAVAPIGVICGRLANFINGELWGRATDVAWAVIFPKSIEGSPFTNPADEHRWQLTHLELAVPRHPSQLYGVVAEGLIPLLLIIPLHARHRKPGLTLGVLLMLYAAGRIIDEFFRERDRVQPLAIGWMNEGQVLSLPVLVLGAWLAWRALRRPAMPDLYRAPASDSGG